MTTYRVGLKHIQQLAGTGPNQFQPSMRTEQFESGSHQRNGVPASVGDAAGEYGNIRRRTAGKGARNSLHLLDRQQGSYVQFHTRVRELPDQIERWLASGIGHWYLDVDVLTPTSDLVCLPGHFTEVIGEDLERNRPVPDNREDIAS